MPSTKNTDTCDRIIIGLDPLMISGIEAAHWAAWGRPFTFPKMAVYALEELYWVMFKLPKAEAPELPPFDPKKKFMAPPSKFRRADDGYFLMEVPNIIQDEYKLLLKAHGGNKTGLLNRALVLLYRAVRDGQARRGNKSFLAKYPEI